MTTIVVISDYKQEKNPQKKLI